MDFLRRIDRFLSSYLSPAVKKILVLNVAVFLGIQFAFIFLPRDFVDKLILVVLAENPSYSIPRLFVWQFVTYMFIHTNGMHLLFNMMVLWFFGPEIEHRWGTSRFWRFYLTVGAGAGFLHAVISLFISGSLAPIVGASGALFGILFAYWAYYPNRMVYVWGALPVLVKWLVPIIVLFEIFALRSNDNLSHLTHLSGIVVAFIYLSRYHRTTDLQRWKYMG